MKRFLVISFLFSIATYAFAQTGQTVKGRVIDDASQSPLPGVNVVIRSVDPVIGASTDMSGYYTINEVPLGRHTIEFTFIGYEKRVASDIIVTAGKEVVINMAMVEAFETLQEAEVVYDAADDKTSATNDMAVISARSFNLEETRQIRRRSWRSQPDGRQFCRSGYGQTMPATISSFVVIRHWACFGRLTG